MTYSHERSSYSDADPSIDEGRFLDFDNPVRERGVRHLGRPEHHPYATYHEHQVTMEDGTRYLVTTTEIPEKYQRDSSDVANIETTAWLTQRNGLNKRRMAELAKRAIPSVFVSVQQNKSKIGNLTRNAHNEIEIAKSMADIYDFDKKAAIVNGISRGAMTGLAVSSVADQHDVYIPYTDAIVPCFPNGLNIPEDLVEYIKLLPNEASTLKAIREVPLRYLRRYPNTLDRNIFQQLKEVPTLLGGAVGDQVRRNMHPDTFGYVTVYEGDIMSQGKRWQELFTGEDYPNIVLDSIHGGGHLSCVGNDCFSDWKDRTDTISELLHENPSNRYLGGTALRKLASERNPAFLQSIEPYPLQAS